MKLNDLMRDIGLELRMDVDNVVMLTDLSAKQAEVERTRADMERYTKANRELENVLSSSGAANDEQRAMLAKASSRSAKAVPLVGKIIDLGLTGRNEEAMQGLEQELQPVQKQWKAALDDLIGAEEKLNEQDRSHVRGRNRPAARCVARHRNANAGQVEEGWFSSDWRLTRWTKVTSSPKIAPI